MGEKIIVDKAVIAKLYEDSLMLRIVRKVIEDDDNKYGFEYKTKVFIDTLLGIERPEEEK